jgi:stage III sporulation protein AB
MVSEVLFFISLSIIPYMFRDSITRLYYSFNDSKTPFYIAISSIALKFIFNSILVKPLGINGIALSTVLITTINACLLAFLIRKRITLGYRAFASQIFKILALCLTVCAFCIIIKPRNSEYALIVSIAAGVFISLMLLMVSGVAVSFVYVAEYKRNYNFVKGVISAFEFMEGDIVHKHSFLADAFKEAAAYAGTAGWFIKELGDNMREKVSAEEAFEKINADTGERLGKILKDYFKQAGMLDTKGEQKKLAGVILRLKAEEKQQQKYIEGTVYQNRKIIIAFTVLICVFLA